jgi:sterol desaturase/sphingolipid hydroxylase (fatty acid hydroxylase superfamily)
MAQVETEKRRDQNMLRAAWIFLKALVSPQMSPVFFFLDFIVYPPIILFGVVWGLHTNISHPAWFAAAMFPLGLVTWTLAEYLAHRFVLHKVPGIADLHQAHHDETLELIGTPTLVSLAVLFTLAFCPAYYLMGSALAWLWFAGFVAGFVAYTFVHYAVHHFSSGGYAIMKMLKWQHNIHHHGTSSFNFGVTSPLWDHVFRTYTKTMREAAKH